VPNHPPRRRFLQWFFLALCLVVMAFTAPTVSPAFDLLDSLFFWAFAQIPPTVDWDVSTIESACQVAFALAAVLAILLVVFLFRPRRTQIRPRPVAIPAGERPSGNQPTAQAVREILARKLTPPRRPSAVAFTAVAVVFASGAALLWLESHPQILGSYSRAFLESAPYGARAEVSELLRVGTLISGCILLGIALERRKSKAAFRVWQAADEKRAWAQSWWDYWRKTEGDNLKIWQDYRPGYMDYVRRLKAWEQLKAQSIAEAEANRNLRDREVPRLLADFQKAFTSVRYQAALDNPPITAEADLKALFAAAFPDLPVSRDPMLVTALPYMADVPVVALVADRYRIGRMPPVAFDEAVFVASNPMPVPPQRPNVVYYTNWEPLEHWRQHKGQWYPQNKLPA
jgi:hypothetical protein